MGFGIGFIFVPLTTLAVGTLRNEQIGNATGIQNLVRNIGGSIGISFVSTMLERYAQAHQYFMTTRLTPLEPGYQQRIGTVQHIFGTTFSSVDALARSQGAIYNVLLQQANYWAFVELFYAFALACVASTLGVLFFQRVKATGAIHLE
jgi:DHA2 family multidrug resistance protein